jgi:adenosyl cobinamide kinase/adenosyl cobinamide phosphate guanylyltransferase
MDVQLLGTGGPAGWPQPGCRCASCSAAARAGLVRAPAEVLIDGILRIGGLPLPAPPARYLAEPVSGGLDVTAPDGTRLLWAAGPGAVPHPAEDAAPYDAALLDVLGDPAQLGLLRRRGLITEATTVAAIHIDHRVPSQQELARRCRLWRVTEIADGGHLTVRAPAEPAQPGQPAEPAQPCAPHGPHAPWRVLLLGGARSGKSREAELRLAGEPEVTYIAAAGPAASDDAEWAARVAAHRSRRPAWWRTVETTDVAAVLRAATGAVLIDSIGTWLAAVMDECGAWHRPPGESPAAESPAAESAVTSRLASRVGELIGAWRDTSGRVVAVSDETGSGVVPGTESGRMFRDELGHLNQLLAAESEEAILVVAGRGLPLPGLAESC